MIKEKVTVMYETLIAKAKEGMANAYAPYSNYKVGAALLTKSGKVYTGCNVENVSYGGTICAERVAVFKAVSEGETEFEAIAIVTAVDDFPTPCGFCRQVLAEFADENFKIVLANDEKTEVYSMEALLPLSFTKENLELAKE